MSKIEVTTTKYPFLSGGGETGNHIRSKDWSKSKIGTPGEWPHSLQTIVSMLLNQPLGMSIAWGRDYTQIYNDAYSELLKNSGLSEVLGIEASKSFPEIWTRLEPIYSDVMKGKSLRIAHVDFYPSKKKRPKDIQFDLSFSPVYAESGEIGGVLTTIIENAYKDKTIENLPFDQENIFTRIVMDSPNGICIINAGNSIIEIVNKRFIEISGKSESDLIGNHFWKIFAESLTLYENNFNDLIRSGQSFSAREVKFNVGNNGNNQKASGTFVFYPIKNDEGKVIKVAFREEENILRVEIRKKIAKRENEMRTLVESAPFPIGVFSGQEIKIEMANQSIISAWGKGDDVVGKLYTDILPEFENQEIFEQIRGVYNTGVPFHAKNRRVDMVKNGVLRPYYFNYSLTPLFDSSGKVYGVMNTAAEVTELQEAKQKVEKALEDLKLFKFMADAAVDSFVLIREDGSFTYLNNIALEKWGYSKDEIKNLKLQDITRDFNPDIFRKIFRKAQTETIQPFETLLKSKNGQVYPIEVNVGGLSLDAKPFMFAIARDITYRKESEKELMSAFKKLEESEKRFRNSIQQAPMGIVVLRGKDFFVEQANEAYLNIIDKEPDEFIGHPIFEALPEVKDTIKPIFENVMGTGEPFYGNEFEVTFNRMGKLQTTWFNFVYQPLKEENGKISGIVAVAMEVTTLVKAKHSLEESEKHFRNMIRHSPIPMTILRGEDFVIQSVNKAMLEKIWRKKEEDVLEKPLLEVFPEFKSQKYAGLLKKVFTTGTKYVENESLMYVNGDDGNRQFYLDFEYAPLLEPDGKVSGILITASDVTVKVDARKKVEDAEERLRLSTEVTGIASWDLDLLTRQIIYSPRLTEIFGHDQNTVLTPKEFRQQIHPEDLFIVEKQFELALEDGTYEYEARIIKPDNKTAWIRTQGKVFYDENHKPVKMLGTLRDITEEKRYQQVLQKSELKFRLLANSLPQQVWTADDNGNIFYFNDTVLKYTGLTLAQLENGQWINVVHPEDTEVNIKAWNHSISTGKDFLLEHRFKRFDGEYRWQLSRALPQRDASGKIQMWIGSSTDIQDIKEQELQKDYFISMASHELKTPLTSIKGYVQILQTMQPKVETPFLAKSLKVMDKQINKLTELIGELLDVSKIKSGGLDFKKEYFELTELINEVVDEIRHINPIYEINLFTETKITVFADRNRIGQVLINLLNNAVKYSPQSYTINVRCSLGKNAVNIKIEDFGIGINKSEQQRIFDRFYRVEGRDEKTFPGFGIGLFISSEIIKKHRGQIHLKSTVGKGSVFTIDLPLTDK